MRALVQDIILVKVPRWDSLAHNKYIEKNGGEQRRVPTEGDYRQIGRCEEFWREGFDFGVCQKDYQALGSGPGGGSVV